MIGSSKRISKNIAFNWIGMGFGMVLGFIQAPIVVIGLGNTWYGTWVLINQITGYTWVFDLGIREAVVRYVSKHHTRKEFREINEIVSTAIYLYLFISVLTIAVVSVLVLLLPHIFKLDESIVPVARLVLFLTGLNIAINWFFNAYIGILMGLQRFDIFQKIGMIMSVLGFILVVTVLKAGFGILALSLVGLGGTIISNTLIYWQCRKLLPEFKFLRLTRNKMQFKPLINYGKYVFINNISSKIIFATDALVIGIFLPVSFITFYAIPSTLVSYMRGLIEMSTWVLTPFFSELESKNDLARIKSVLAGGTKLSLLLGLPVGIVYLIMGKNFISLWMGKEYGEGSASVLIILTLPAIFGLWRHIINSALHGLSRHHIIAYLLIGEASANIILSVIFVRIWGIVGVALGTAIPHILFMGIILPVVVCRNLGISSISYLRQSILPPFFSSVPFTICCYVVNVYFPAKNLVVFFLWIASIMPVFLVFAWYISFSKVERDTNFETACRYIPALRFFSKKGIARV